MRFHQHYLNCKLADTAYLLPYGQGIADHAAGMQVNPVSARLWDAVCQGADRDSLLALLKEEYEATDADLPELQLDLDTFLSVLSRQGMLLSDEPPLPAAYPDYVMQAGPLRIALKVPDDLWRTYFSAFACPEGEGNTGGSGCDGSKPHQQVALFHQPPVPRMNGEILIRSDELLIARTDSHYLFLPLTDSAFSEMRVTTDGTRAEIYCRPLLTEADREEIFHAIRFAFLVVAARHDLYVVHSASLLYRGRAWLFSGSSGTGKSTHTNLWRDSFHTPILNGDLNMIGLEDGAPMCYGLPWCGTSGINTAQNLPLGGITFLRQSPANKVISPAADKKTLYLLQRLISPCWTAGQLTRAIAFCEKMTADIPVFRLQCTREPSAAELMRAAIDAYLDSVPQK